MINPHPTDSRCDTDTDLMILDPGRLRDLADTCTARVPNPATCDACAARALL